MKDEGQKGKDDMKTHLSEKHNPNSMRFKNFTRFRLALFLTSIILLTSVLHANAQHEELKQRIAAFVEAQADKFDKKYLNETEPKYGELNNTNFEFHDYFLLKAKEKTTNSIGNTGKLKLDYSFFAYESAEECDYALSFWFKNFLEEKRITPGREVRTYKGVQPTIVIINKTNVCLVTFSCLDYDIELFRTLRKEMLTFFGDTESMIIEINCDGPLNWTKNPPDPKDPKWRK